jgi:hypothetical protein
MRKSKGTPVLSFPRGGELIWVNLAYPKPVVLTQIGGEESHDFYVAPKVAKGLVRPGNEFMLFMVATKDRGSFLWPVRCPVPQEHFAYQAMDRWFRFPVMH